MWCHEGVATATIGKKPVKPYIVKATKQALQSLIPRRGLVVGVNRSWSHGYQGRLSSRSVDVTSEGDRFFRAVP